jgi:hypothetical protein
MTEHQGLPVAGYRPQSQAKIDLVNLNKVSEEAMLRDLDTLAASGVADRCMLAIGRTHLQTAFMWINRSILQPGRVALPDDPEQSGEVATS